MSQMITDITGAVDFGAVLTGIGVVAAAVAVIYVGMKGARMLLNAVRSV